MSDETDMWVSYERFCGRINQYLTKMFFQQIDSYRFCILQKLKQDETISPK